MFKNPQESTYLKLPSKVFYLWSLMDGTRSVKELVVAYFTKFGTFAFDRVENLIGQLKQKRFLTEKPVGVFQHIESELSKQSLGHKTNLFWQSFLHRQSTVRGLDGFLTLEVVAGKKGSNLGIQGWVRDFHLGSRIHIMFGSHV